MDVSLSGGGGSRGGGGGGGSGGGSGGGYGRASPCAAAAGAEAAEAEGGVGQPGSQRQDCTSPLSSRQALARFPTSPGSPPHHAAGRSLEGLL
jgi:hypothetical protein